MSMSKEKRLLTLDDSIRPSGAYRVLACPGSVYECEGLEKPEPGEWAVRGTRLHKTFESLVQAHMLGVDLAIPVEDVETLRDAEDLQPLVQAFFAEDRFTGCPLEDGRYKLETEKPLEFEAFDITIKGTADIVLTWFAQDREVYLEIGDLKTGYQLVDPAGNPQLLIYAAAKIQGMKKMPSLVRLSIIQGGRVVNATYSGEEVIELANDIMKKLAEARASKGPLAPGDHCRYCPASSQCPARVGAAFDVVEVVEVVEAGGDVGALVATEDRALSGLATLPADKLEKLVLLKGQIEDLLAEAIVEALRRFKIDPQRFAKDFPALKAVTSITRKKLVDTEDLVKTYGDAVLESKVKSVKEVEKAIGADAASRYIVKPEGKVEIVPRSDRRKEIEGLLTEPNFEVIEG